MLARRGWKNGGGASTTPGPRSRCLAHGPTPGMIAPLHSTSLTTKPQPSLARDGRPQASSPDFNRQATLARPGLSSMRPTSGALPRFRANAALQPGGRPRGRGSRPAAACRYLAEGDANGERQRRAAVTAQPPPPTRYSIYKSRPLSRAAKPLSAAAGVSRRSAMCSKIGRK